MRNAFFVAWREFVENAKTRGFWIGIFMMPLIIFLSVQVPVFLEKKGTPTRHFVLVDESEEFEPAILEALEEQHRGQMEQARAKGEPEPSRLYERVPAPEAANLEGMAEALRPYLKGDKPMSFHGHGVHLDAAVLIPRGITNAVIRESDQGKSGEKAGEGIQYWSVNLADRALRNLVENAVNQEVRKREYLARGLDVALFRQVEKTRLPLVELNPKKEAGQERVSKAEAVAHWAPVAFVYLLWVSLFTISQMLLSNTIEEKSNRIIEVLLSSVTPAEFVLGKLAGIAAVGLTMISAWLGSLFVIIGWTTGGQSQLGMQVLEVLKSSSLIPAFVIYFFFGYLLYAGIILAIGSVCNTIKEAQNYMGVITLLMMVPLMTMMFIAKDPNGPVAKVLSWVPIYTPFVMMNRAAAEPPMFEIVGTMLLLALSTAGVLWGAVKIFRMGILRTGQPPRVVEMLRWLRAK